MTSEVVWTALPNGRDDDVLHLSVHVSPRLTTPTASATLADFPAMVGWPPPDLSVDVVLPGAAPYRGKIVSTPDPSLWSQLFPPSSRVTSHAFRDYSALPVHTFPLTKVVAFLKSQYTAVALESPESFPTIDDLLAAGFQDIDFAGPEGRRRWQETLDGLRVALDSVGVVDTRASSDPTFDFVQLRDFFAPVDISDPAVEAALVAKPELPGIDFHAAVQFVNQHPPLLRLLGLVLDVDVDLRGQPAPPSGATTVHVQAASGQLGTVTNRTPKTHCLLDTSRFDPEPRPTATHLAGRFLRFEDTSEFATVQVDADGGGIKAVDFAGNLTRRTLHPTEDTPTDAGLPTLRADGVSVARLGQAAQLKAKLGLLAQQNGDLGAGQLELWAEDLVRGHRIDVWDSRSKSWHSLMHRTGCYQLNAGTTEIPVEDEGFLVANATKKPAQEDLYVTEEVFTWDGWSLVAPRPGRTLNTDPQAEDPMLDRPPNAPGPDVDVRFHFDATPGTLPMLRYGVDYRFRARTVDLGGNSAPASDPDLTHATAPLTFGRFEPPQTPPVLLRDPRGPGESMETVVVRSNFDAAPAAPAQRHLVPPKVGEYTVELHAALDVPHPGNPAVVVLDADAYQVLEKRDAATLLTHDDGEPDPENPAALRYYPVDVLNVPYTPDPAARRLALRLLDGPNAGFVGTYPLLADGADWPDFHSLRLVVDQGSGTPSLTGQVLRVPLGKGDVVRARLSAVVDPADLDAFGLWHWIKDAGPSAQALAHLEKLVDAGQHWMFEPFRVLTLVHAVRQPLATPELLGLSTSRGLGASWALVSGVLELSRTSTSRVDVLASWQDPVDEGAGTGLPDEPGQPGSRAVVDQSALVLDIEHRDGLPPGSEQLRHRHELGDTKHHLVTYRALATSRFTEYFTSRDTFPYGGAESPQPLDTGSPPQGLVPGSVKLTQRFTDGTSTVLVEGRHFTVDATQGTLTFTKAVDEGVEPPAAGGDIVATYLVPPVTRETAAPPASREVAVPSSARPAAPKVVYALPTFGWDQAVTAGGATSTRHGNGVRIYLERPWWSSGAGELLGVVTWPPAEQPAPSELHDGDPLRPYVTQWGEDPVFAAGALTSRYPGLSAFPGATATGTGLTLDELTPAAPVVNVAGHTVAYDPDRDLWFCDVDVHPGAAYQPFVRLALARYQPQSIAGAHLSRVVLADFVQLAPDRFATVVFGDQATATITLTGPAPYATEVATGPGLARVTVQKRHAPVADPDLGWRDVGQPATLAAQVSDGQATWTGTVDLPHPPGQGEVRLAVEQYDIVGLEQVSQSPNPWVPGQAERLVYSDLIVV